MISRALLVLLSVPVVRTRTALWKSRRAPDDCSLPVVRHSSWFRVSTVFLGNDCRLLIPHRHPMNGVSTTLLTSSFSEGRGKTLGQVGVQLTDQPGQRRIAVEGLFNLAAGMQDCAVIASAEVGSDLLQRQRR